MMKLLSLRHWSNTFKMVFKLLMSSQVKLWEKAFFVIPVVVYWLIPADLIPLLPIDDIGITMILAHWFAERLSKRYNIPIG